MGKGPFSQAVPYSKVSEIDLPEKSLQRTRIWINNTFLLLFGASRIGSSLFLSSLFLIVVLLGQAAQHFRETLLNRHPLYREEPADQASLSH